MTGHRMLPRALAIAGLVLAFSSGVRAQAHHEHEKPDEKAPTAAKDGAPQELPPFIPRLTDEDRKAAFPEVAGHAVHDKAVNFYVLLDRLEWQPAQGGVHLDATGWIGRDRRRLWFRADGDHADGRIGGAQAQVLYGHQFARWWDLVGGIRHDFRPGSPETWAAIGIQGLAPYWFEIDATAYVSASGRTQARFDIEYELLLTNRLVLQPQVDMELAGELSRVDSGLRLRYEIRREVAPYVGVAWSRIRLEGADAAGAEEKERGGARMVTGLRIWF